MHVNWANRKYTHFQYILLQSITKDPCFMFSESLNFNAF